MGSVWKNNLGFLVDFDQTSNPQKKTLVICAAIAKEGVSVLRRLLKCLSEQLHFID